MNGKKALQVALIFLFGLVLMLLVSHQPDEVLETATPTSIHFKEGQP